MRMKVRLGDLRQAIRRALNEEAWVPGRYYPAAEPLSGEDRDRLDQPLGEEDEDDLDEVYIVDESGPPGAGMGADPTKSDDKPYREQDPYEQLGMHPKPTDAGSPPSTGGGEASPAEPPDEPTEGT